jgi:hypothetical protein
MNTPKTYRRQQRLDIVEACITGGKVSDDLLEELEIGDPEDGVSRLDAATARVLLQSVGSDLPYVAHMTSGTFFSTQRQWQADPELHFDPQLLFTVNWAMGPSQDWLEAFYATHIPGFDVWVVTASHGSDDLFGCLDYAIGVSESGASLEESAKKILKDYLTRRKRDHQDRWVAVKAFGVFSNESICHLENEIWA